MRVGPLIGPRGLSPAKPGFTAAPIVPPRSAQCQQEDRPNSAPARRTGAGKRVIPKAAKGRQRPPKAANWRSSTNTYDFKAFVRRAPKIANSIYPGT
jgi:hypothetical protein